MRRRLLEVDVLSRRERIEEHLFVPVVRGRDDHGLHFLLIEELAVVVELDRFRAGPGGGLIAMRLINVGHGHQVRRLPRAWSSIGESRSELDPSVWVSGGPSTAKPGRLSQSRRSEPVHWLQQRQQRNGRQQGRSDMPRSSTGGTLEKASSCGFVVGFHAGRPSPRSALLNGKMHRSISQLERWAKQLFPLRIPPRWSSRAIST